MIEFKYVVLAFVIMMAIGRLALLDLKPIVWKQIEYVWVLLAVFGLVGATYTSRDYFGQGELRADNDTLTANVRYMQDFVDLRQRELCSKTTPSNERDLCHYLENNQLVFAAMTSARRYIQLAPFDSPSHEAGPILSDLKKVVDQYNAVLNEHDKTVERLEAFSILKGFNNLFELVEKVLGPLALAVSLALKLTQTAAEIRRERMHGSPAV